LNGYVYFIDNRHPLPAIPEAEVNMGAGLERIRFTEFERAYDDKRTVSFEEALFCNFGGFLSRLSSGTRHGSRSLHVARLAISEVRQASGSDQQTDGGDGENYGCDKQTASEFSQFPSEVD
jgi:hypothetical protein